MYSIKTDLIKDLKGGRTARYIAEILDVTESYISMIFNNKAQCTKIVAMGLLSIRFNIPVNHDNMENLLEKFFIHTINDSKKTMAEKKSFILDNESKIIPNEQQKNYNSDNELKKIADQMMQLLS